MARDPKIGIPISGIGGISTWRDAAEFIALGATSVQVCTAVMHHGYRVVDDMISGLSRYLDEKGMRSVNELRGRAIEQYKEWGELDLNYKLVAKIDDKKCIGCQLCYTACLDGAHQCIHVQESSCSAYHGESDHGMNPRSEVKAPVTHGRIQALSSVRVPFIDTNECVGCNLCQIVCPVTDCITMEEITTNRPKESWNDRVEAGRGNVPGGMADLRLGL